MEQPQFDKTDPQIRLDYWLRKGASKRAATALSVAQCDNIEQARAIGQDRFECISNCGPKTLREIGSLIGGWGTGPVDVVRTSLSTTLPEPVRGRTAARIVAMLMQHGFMTIGRGRS